MFIKLNKDSFSNGEKTGSLCRKVINNRLKAVYLIKNKKNISLNTRIEEFKKNILSVSPHWLSEVNGIAKGAGVKSEDILMLNCLPPNFYKNSGNNCTSFIIVKPDTVKLFKIRDERNHVQSFMIKNENDLPGYQMGHDIGNIGIAHFFNQHHVAGAINTGSPSLNVEDKPGLNDCHIMRFFAENAKHAADIPILYEKLLAKKVVAGSSDERGSIFICADPEKSIIMETNMKEYSLEYLKEGSSHVIANHFVTKKARKWELRPPNKNTTSRYERMSAMLEKYNGDPSLKEIFNISRDRKNIPNALCNDDRQHFWMSISAQLQVINRASPEKSLNYICCGNPRHALYLPISIQEKENFISLTDGSFYNIADALYHKHYCSNHFRKIQNAFERKISEKAGDKNIYEEAYDLMSEALNN